METGAMRSEADLKKAVSQFQEMAGLPINGNMRDPKVIKKMKEPRCEALDTDAGGPQNFVLGSNKWDKNDLTYKSVALNNSDSEYDNMFSDDGDLSLFIDY